MYLQKRRYPHSYRDREKRISVSASTNTGPAGASAPARCALPSFVHSRIPAAASDPFSTGQRVPLHLMRLATAAADSTELSIQGIPMWVMTI